MDEELKTFLDDFTTEKQSGGLQDQVEKYGSVDAFLSGTGQGVTLGFSDELKALYRKYSEGIPYDQALAEEQQRLQEIQKESPRAYAAGDVAGTIGASVPAAIGAAAVPPAALALLAGVGSLEGAGRSKPGERAEGAAIGGVTGAMFGLAGKVLGPLVRKSSALVQDALGGKGGQVLKNKETVNILRQLKDEIKNIQKAEGDKFYDLNRSINEAMKAKQTELRVAKAFARKTPVTERIAQPKLPGGRELGVAEQLFQKFAPSSLKVLGKAIGFLPKIEQPLLKTGAAIAPASVMGTSALLQSQLGGGEQ